MPAMADPGGEADDAGAGDGEGAADGAAETARPTEADEAAGEHAARRGPDRRDVLTGAGGLAAGVTIGWFRPRATEVIRATGSADVWPSGGDDTEAVQRALDSNAVVQLASGTFGIRSVRLSSGNRLLLTPATTIRALPLASGDTQAVLWVNDADDVVIDGGTLDGRDGPVTLGISIQGSTRVRVVGTHAVGFRTDGGRKGDGFYVSSSASKRESVDIVLDSVVAEANERQGLSVIAVRRMRIVDSSFTNTSGDAPGAGIDFEPNTDAQTIDDVVVSGCSFTGNQHGIMCYLKGKEILTRLVVTSCVMADNREYGFSGLLPLCQELQLAHNLVRNNTAGGVLVGGAELAVLDANVVRDNVGGRGVELHSVGRWQLTGNQVSGNSGDGVLALQQTDGTSFGICQANQIWDNGRDQADAVGLRLSAERGDVQAIVNSNWFRNSRPPGPQSAAVHAGRNTQVFDTAANQVVGQPASSG